MFDRPDNNDDGDTTTLCMGKKSGVMLRLPTISRSAPCLVEEDPEEKIVVADVAEDEGGKKRNVSNNIS